MSEILRSDYTHQLEEAKKRLDKFFRIVVREDAMRIIDEMKSILVDNTKWTHLGDKQAELLKILENVPEYMDKYYIEESDGTRLPRELIRSFRYDKNKENIEKAIKVYKKYTQKIKSITEVNRDIDVLFLEKLNAVFSEYKSSTDYMTRLVKRLLRYNVNNDGDFKETDTTRVLILKQFIKQFGYNCVNEIKCSELETVINEEYNGNIKDIDDSIFSLIEDAGGEKENAANGQIVYDNNYISSITKLQDTIKIKAPLIYVTEDICMQIFEVLNNNVLSHKVIDGSAVLLSDCFSKSYFKIQLEDFRSYQNIKDTGKLDSLNKQLQDRYQHGYLLYTDFPHSDRLYTIMKKYSSMVVIKNGGKKNKLLRKLYENAIISQGKTANKEIKLSDIFDVEKIQYQEIDETNNRLVEALESKLFALPELEKSSDLSRKRKEFKKSYSYAVGIEYEKREEKTIGEPISFNNYSLLYRLIVVISKYSAIIPLSEESRTLLLKALPEIAFPEEFKNGLLSDYIDKSIVEKVKGLREEENSEKYDARMAFLSFAESFIEDKSEYVGKLRERIENRYNNSSKVGGTDFIINKNALYSLGGTNVYEYKLLKIADNLANAVFSSQKKTREYLYIFAIAFDIRRVENGHPERIVDIEKNLFWDYYADNIVNNLPKVAGLGDDSDVFIDGYGVNYKNFAEVIFLWSLEQKDKTPKERLKMAYDIIEYCKKEGKTEEEFFKDVSNSKAFDTKTEIYKDEFSKIKKFPEEKFKEFIIENYPCKSTNSGIMQISAEQRTAGEIIREQEKKVNYLLKRVVEDLLYDVTEEDLFWRFSENSILADFFNEYEYLTNKRCKNCPKKSTSVFPYCKKYFDEFSYEEKDDNEIKDKKIVTVKNCGEFYVRYLDNHCKKAQDLLRHNVQLKVKSFKPVEEHFKKSFSRVNELCNDNQEPLKLLLNRIKGRLQADTTGEIHFKNVSRTTMIALCFYEFVLINWARRISNDTIFGAFEKVYDSFCNGTVFTIKPDDLEGKNKEDYEIIVYEGANRRLVSAGYQPIDPKNIFDIYLIYIAYRDNFLPIYSSQDDALIDLYSGYKKVFDELKKSRGDRIIDKDNISKDR